VAHSPQQASESERERSCAISFLQCRRSLTRDARPFPFGLACLLREWATGPCRLETSVRVLDPEGAHLAALLRLGNFRGLRVLEHGCGEGRLTVGIAADAASVLAFDPTPPRSTSAASLASGRARRSRRLSRRFGCEDRARAEILRPHCLLLVALMSAARGRRARPGTTWFRR